MASITRHFITNDKITDYQFLYVGIVIVSSV